MSEQPKEVKMNDIEKRRRSRAAKKAANTRALAFNTTFLPNGVHRLVLRAKLPVTFNGQPVMKMGIQMVPFQVKN